MVIVGRTNITEKIAPIDDMDKENGGHFLDTGTLVDRGLPYKRKRIDQDGDLPPQRVLSDISALTNSSATSMDMTTNPGHTQPVAGQGSNTDTSKPILWSGSEAPSVREITVYSILMEKFGNDKPFRVRNPQQPQLQEAVRAINLVLPNEDRVSSERLSKYFQRATARTPGAGFGKYRGKLRWVRFSSVFSTVRVTHSACLQKALQGSIADEERKSLLICIGECVGEWDPASSPPSLKQANVPLDFDGIKRAVPTNFRWRVTLENGCCIIWHYRTTGGATERSIKVQPNMAYTTHFYDHSLPLLNSNLPVTLTTTEQLTTLLTAVQHATICKGLNYEKYEPLFKARLDGSTFRSKDGTVNAYAEESYTTQRCIRTSGCAILVSATGICSTCRQFDGSLRKDLSRLKNRTPESRASTAITHLTREELVDRVRTKPAPKSVQRQAKQLEELNKKRVTTKHNGEYATLFTKLEHGLDKIQAQANNPQCNWKNCSESFSTIEELQNHIYFNHTKIMETSCQLFPAYECLWSGCSTKPYKSKAAFHAHVRKHTGDSGDILFKYLLEDQARALTVPDHQMRWHPCVLRWCLHQHARSAAAYEDMRSSRLLRLPSGRTLLRYRNFNHPQSGWNDGTLDEMRSVYDKFTDAGKGQVDRANTGGIYFDEVKIKEGLIWDPRSDELIGFVDFAGEPSDVLQNSIATHAFQFHFRSLFS
ncbi:uncharacterized protein LOC135816702 [Sycon ciliatum]